jgi:hypothetical protein
VGREWYNAIEEFAKKPQGLDKAEVEDKKWEALHPRTKGNRREVFTGISY